MDGNLGDETISALGRFLSQHGKNPDPGPNAVSDAELAYVFKLRDLYKAPQTVRPPTWFSDRRTFAGTNMDMGPRTWERTYGICLHQSACTLSASKYDDRCDKIGAHFVVYPTGRVFWLHDLNRMIIHGNAWNTHTIGIEVDGLFAGVAGNPSTVWNDPSTPQREKATTLAQPQIDAVKQLIRWCAAEVARRGGEMTSIVAHRQASSDRRDDPGSEIWQKIGLAMKAELHLEDGGPGFKIDSGYPIPVEWDPTRTGYKY